MGSLSEDRKALPHSMERQLGLKTHPRTAPEGNRCCNFCLLCLYRAAYFGIGGILRVPIYRDCGLLKEIPTAPIAVFQKSKLILFLKSTTVIFSGNRSPVQRFPAVAGFKAAILSPHLISRTNSQVRGARISHLPFLRRSMAIATSNLDAIFSHHSFSH